MTAAVIRAEGLTKLYRIGVRDQRPETLAGHLLQMVTRPVASFRRIRSLGTVTPKDEQSDDVIAALRDVGFEIGSGEVLGVIGINGAGKSTLLKLLCGITEPTSGWAEINGRTTGLLEVGTGFHPELTGRENVYLNGTILGMSRADVDRSFDQIVDFSGVGRFIDTPVKRFSSGMRVRLAFAVAAHLEPEILLIDEVLAVGDAVFQQQCLDRMAELASSGRTLLFVSHNLGAVRRLCTTGLLLGGGSLLDHGPIERVLANYTAITQGTDQGQKDSRERQGITVGMPRILSTGPAAGRSDPLVVETPITIHESFWQVVAQVGLNTHDGRLLTLSSVDSERRPELLTPGTYLLRTSFPPMWLAPLIYPLQIKVIATPTSGRMERFFSPWVHLDVAGEPGLDAHTEALLAPSVAWEFSENSNTLDTGSVGISQTRGELAE